MNVVFGKPRAVKIDERDRSVVKRASESVKA